MDLDAVHALIGKAQFLDVRRSHEYDAGHIEGAAWITLRKLPSKLDQLDRDRPIVVTCEVGQRSDLGATLLREEGFDAHNLDGGLEGWVKAGFRLVSSDGRTGRLVSGWAETMEHRPT